MELRTAFQLTDCGSTPEDWCLRPVRDMGKVIAGKALAVDAPGKLQPYLRTKNVFDGCIDIDDVLSMPMTDEQFRQFMLQDGDVLLNEGQSLELVGRCAIYGGEYPGPCAIQNQLLRFRAYADVSGLFASHLFRYCQRMGVFARAALQTTSIAHLGATRFEQLLLPWPPTEAEQRAIARVLSDVDALLDGLNLLIAKKRGLKQAVIQQLLTGKTRLPDFSGKCRTKRLGEIASIRNQKVLPLNAGNDTLCVELDHIGQGTGRLLQYSTAQNSTSSKYRFLSGDVLFGRLRSYLRKFWHADQDGICTTEVWPLMTDSRQADSGFLHAIVQSDRFIEVACISYGTHMPRADWGVVQNLEVRLPPVREQREIAAVLSDIDAEIAALEARRDKTLDLKQAMMQELLTGKTRLVQPEVAHA